MTKTPIIPIGFYVSSDHLHNINLRKKGHISHGAGSLVGIVTWKLARHGYPVRKIAGA